MKKRYRRRKPKSKQHSSEPFIDAHFAEMQHPLSHVPEEKWEEIRQQIGSEVEQEHGRLLSRFDSLLHFCNPLQTMAHFAFFDRFLYEIQKGEQYKPLSQHSLEFFQGYFLTVPVTELKVRMTPVPVLMELNEVLRGLELTFLMLGVGRPREDATDARTRAGLGQQVRMHTFGVRNAGYYQQVMMQLRGIFGRMDTEFERLRGLKLSGLVTMSERILTLVQDRLQKQIKVAFVVTRRKTPIHAINAYCDARELSIDVRNEMLDQCHTEGLTLEDARSMCANHASLSLPQIYSIDLSDFVAAYPDPIDPACLLAVLLEWSVPPEGLVGSNRAHLFLSNPIWHKPIIQIGPRSFFWPMIELFHSFGLEMLEGLIRSEASLWDRYQGRVRGTFLEERVYELCQSAFPGAQVFRGSLWLNDKNEVDGENDVLVVIDDLALTIECKSGRITPEARRGLPGRLRTEVKKLIEDATKQSERFARLLMHSNEVLRLPTRRRSVNEIDATKIKRVVRLNVTLDFFGPLACAVRELLDAKLIDSAVATAPTLALVDFENVLHVLETPLERLHYFTRRADIERNISLVSDEEDLLACYLATGLNFGQLEEEHTGRLALGNMGESIQPYLLAYYAGRVSTKPRRRFTNWWKQILQRLQSVAFRHWTRAGFVFLDVRHEDQVNFERAVKRLIKEVKLRWHDPSHMNRVLGMNGPSKRRTAICAVVLKGATRERRDDELNRAIAHAVETAKTDDVVALCFKAETPTWPYSTLAFYDPDTKQGTA